MVCRAFGEGDGVVRVCGSCKSEGKERKERERRNGEARNKEHYEKEKGKNRGGIAKSATRRDMQAQHNGFIHLDHMEQRGGVQERYSAAE